MKNKRALITAGAVVLFLACPWLKAKMTFSSIARQLDSVFTEGIHHDGLSVSHDLNEKQNIAVNLTTIAKRTVKEADDAVIRLTKAAEAMRAETDPAALAELEVQLDTAFETLLNKLESVPMSEKDSGYVQQFSVDYQACSDRIRRDGYHEQVRLADEQLSQFPASLLMKLTFSSISVYE